MIPEIMIIDLLMLTNNKTFHYNYHCLDSYIEHILSYQRTMCLINRSKNSLNIKKMKLVIWSNALVICKIDSHKFSQFEE